MRRRERRNTVDNRSYRTKETRNKMFSENTERRREIKRRRRGVGDREKMYYRREKEITWKKEG